MSTFLTYTDYQTRLSERILSIFKAEDPDSLTKATYIAVGKLTDRLADKYSISGELAKSGSARNISLVEYALSIAVYSLYSKVSDQEIPERIIKDYDDAMSDLKLISQGKLSCTLPLNTDTEGNTTSRIRMGSNDPRSHNPYRYP